MAESFSVLTNGLNNIEQWYTPQYHYTGMFQYEMQATNTRINFAIPTKYDLLIIYHIDLVYTQNSVNICQSLLHPLLMKVGTNVPYILSMESSGTNNQDNMQIRVMKHISQANPLFCTDTFLATSQYNLNDANRLEFKYINFMTFKKNF